MTEIGQRARSSSFAGAVAHAELSGARTTYITLILSLVALLSAMDTNMLSVLLVPIQNDIHASDAAMGALSGLAYSLVFAVAALPIGRLADVSNRRNILAASAVIWSVGTAMCGLSSGYIQLLLARMGVAAGTAAQAPVTASLVGDLYTPTRRGSGLAAVAVGGLVGLSAGATLAGFLTDRYGWHLAFLLLGLPGLIVAVLLYFTVPEPARGTKDGVAPDGPRATTWASIKYIFSVRTVWLLMIAQGILTAGWQAWLTWLPALLMRVHHLSATQMSAIYGLVVGAGALVSIIVGGIVSDWLSKHGARWRMYYVVVSLLVSVPLAAWGVLAGDVKTAVIVIFFYTLCAGGITAPLAAAGLGVVHPRVRATMSAVLSFVVLALGGGIGPVLIGGLNDALHKSYGDLAIRYSLLLSPVLITVAALIFLAASRTIDRDTAAASEAPPT